ncbi:hypothetical protein O1W69_02650 [Chlamydia sp. 12-01]|uniref:hypothetical protein n=1 Tax=Chlamydia sp. 12-01 TaxID=3002742 RepID=UPI0035D4B68F
MSVNTSTPIGMETKSVSCCDVRNVRVNRVASLITIFTSLALIGGLFTLLIHFGEGAPIRFLAALGMAIAAGLLLICMMGYYLVRHATSLKLLRRQEEILNESTKKVEELETKVQSR